MINRDDYSAPALRAWRQFLRERYQSDEKLAQAWSQPGATIAQAQIPELDQKGTAVRGLLDPGKYRNFIDYREFKEARIWQNADIFARVFREEFGADKLVMTYCMGGAWKKNFDAFFKTSIDCFVPQPSYSNRLPGLSGGLDMVAESYKRHQKYAVAELDFRNVMRCIYNEVRDMWTGVPYSTREFKTMVIKDAGLQIAQGQGFWFYDIGSNQYRHPTTQAIFKKAREVADFVAQKKAQMNFTPEVALVYHQKSLYCEAPFSYHNYGFATAVLDYLNYDLRLSGVPTTGYFLDDLMVENNHAKHKIFVFMNASYLTAQEREFINTKLKKNGNILIWLYAPGILTENSFRPEATAKLTGFELKYHATPRNFEVQKCEFADPLSDNLPQNMGVADVARRYWEMGHYRKSRFYLPSFDITDSQALILGRFTSGGGAVGVKEFPEWTSVFCAAPGGLDAELLYNLARKAGVYTVTRPGLICSVNDFFLSLHACRAGKYEIKLPRQVAVVRDAFTNQVLARDTDHLTLTLEAWKSLWLLLE